MTARKNTRGPLSDPLAEGGSQLSAAGQDFIILSQEPSEAGVVASPANVPILPLKDTVIFPDTMMPLADRTAPIGAPDRRDPAG